MNARDKIISAEKAIGMVKNGDRIAAAFGPAEPNLFLKTLSSSYKTLGLRDLTMLTYILMRDYPFLHDRETFRCESWFLSGAERISQKEGNLTYVPNNLHSAGAYKFKRERPNIFVGTATPPDRYGNISLSLSLVYEKEGIESADLVILEINPDYPRTFGDTNIHISQVDYLIESSGAPVAIPIADPSETERKLGEYVASLVEDESTIQLGIGGIPNAVAKNLMSKKDLGIHTEMITDGMMELFQAGVVTNRKKTLWKDKLVGCFAMGSPKLYEFMKDNLAVELQRGSVTNDPSVMARNRRMVSINTALCIDLTGQVCSESIGPTQYSGTGGQSDTHRGATHSDGGKGIIALKSTAKDGTISTIQPFLPAGAAVTLSRQDIDYVVTEYGIAHLSGLSVSKRIQALINIAHPDFRGELRSQASKIWNMI